MLLQLLFVLIAIIIGARLGGIGLGVLGGLGLAILTFVFGLEPTSPPIDVMLMIVAVIAAASCMQAAGGLVHHCPVFRRCAPFLVVGKAVHFFCPAGGSFIDRVIVDGMHLLYASGHAGPKSYRSSWEGPALSFFGAGGAS